MSEKRVEDNLQGSWVELHYSSGPGGGAAPQEESHGAEARMEASGSTGTTEEEEGGVWQAPPPLGPTTTTTTTPEPEPNTAGSTTSEEDRVPGSTQGGGGGGGGEQTPASTQEAGPVPRSSSRPSSRDQGEVVPGSIVEEEEEEGGGGKAASELTQAGTPPALIQGLDLEKLLLDAQHESGRSSSRGSVPCDSPPRPQTPLHLRSGSEAPSSTEKNSSQSDEDYLERRQEVENVMKKNADWIWDWSSRPENLPPREFLLKHPKRATPLSIRNTRVMKKGGIFSADFLKVFLPSLFLSHILALGLGVYIGRRLTPPSSSF